MGLGISGVPTAPPPPPPPPPAPKASGAPGSPSPTPTATPAPPPDAAKKADDLVHDAQQEQCTVMLPVVGGVNCHTDTDGAKVGKEVAALAKTEPAFARAVLEKAMDKVPSADDRKEIAHGLTDSASHDDLKAMAGTTQGRAMLDRAATELNAGTPSDADKKAATRIDSATKAADLAKDPSFKKLDPATQAQVQAQIKSHETDTAAVDNVVALAKSAGFQSASPSAQKELLGALDHHPGDAIFREGLEKLAANPEFNKLTPVQQGDAIRAFDSFANSEAYKGKEGSWFFNVGAKSVSDADKRKVLDNLTQVVTSQGFNGAAQPTRDQILKTFGDHATDAGFAGRLTHLINDAGFDKAGNSTQLDLLKTYGSDSHFAAGLDNAMTTNPAYAALDAAGRAKVLDDLTKLSKTNSYKDSSDADKQDLVEIVADVADFSAANPSNTITRNSLDHVVNGDIKLQLYDKAPSGGLIEYGYSDGKDIFLNHNAAVRTSGFGNDQYIDTLAHEANHHINGDTNYKTPDRFLDEYRAAVVGHEARLGRPLNASEQLAVLDNLVGTHSAYKNLRDQYLNDPTFKAVCDGIRATLTGSTDPATHVTTPPATVDPEAVRQRLLDGGISSDYLKKAPDLDN